MYDRLVIMHNKVISVHKSNILDSCSELSLAMLQEGTSTLCIFDGNSKKFYMPNDTSSRIVAKDKNMWNVLISKDGNVITIRTATVDGEYIIGKAFPDNQKDNIRDAFNDRFSQEGFSLLI